MKNAQDVINTGSMKILRHPLPFLLMNAYISTWTTCWFSLYSHGVTLKWRSNSRMALNASSLTEMWKWSLVLTLDFASGITSFSIKCIDLDQNLVSCFLTEQIHLWFNLILCKLCPTCSITSYILAVSISTCSVLHYLFSVSNVPLKRHNKHRRRH